MSAKVHEVRFLKEVSCDIATKNDTQDRSWHADDCKGGLDSILYNL